MAKRFTDSDKWERPWFRKMPQAYKWLWLYILDKCDVAGIWYVDMELASFMICEKVVYEEAVIFFDKQIEELDNGNRWFIIGFTEFQYKTLSPISKPHTKVIDILEKFRLLDRVPHRVPPTLPHRVQEEDKDVVVFKEGGVGETISNRFTQPTPEQVTAYAKEIGFILDGDKFVNHYEAGGWMRNKTKIKNWKACVRTWKSNNQENRALGAPSLVAPDPGKVAQADLKMQKLIQREEQKMRERLKI